MNQFLRYRKIVESFGSDIVFHRHQHGEVQSIHDFNASDGESGHGVYAHLPNAQMRKYYTSNGEGSSSIKMNSSDVVDLTHPSNASGLLQHVKSAIDRNAKEIPGYVKPKVNASNVHRFGRLVADYVNTAHPWAKAYIVHHKGVGIPTGKQVVIKDVNAIKEIKKI